MARGLIIPHSTVWPCFLMSLFSLVTQGLGAAPFYVHAIALAPSRQQIRFWRTVSPSSLNHVTSLGQCTVSQCDIIWSLRKHSTHTWPYTSMHICLLRPVSRPEKTMLFSAVWIEILEGGHQIPPLLNDFRSLDRVWVCLCKHTSL